MRHFKLLKIILVTVGILAVVGFVLYGQANAASAAAKRKKHARDLKKSYDSASGLSKLIKITRSSLV